MIRLIQATDWTVLSGVILSYQLAAMRFGWPRVSHLWPINLAFAVGLAAHFALERRNT